MVSIRDFQQLMREICGERDLRRGDFATYAWLVQEVGELARAMLNRDRRDLQEEFADVFAWLCSLANVLNVDLEEASVRRYGRGCPKCGKKPCECEFK